MTPGTPTNTGFFVACLTSHHLTQAWPQTSGHSLTWPNGALSLSRRLSMAYPTPLCGGTRLLRALDPSTDLIAVHSAKAHITHRAKVWQGSILAAKHS